jgi:hypothetical protein
MATMHLKSSTQQSVLRGAPSSFSWRGHLRWKLDRSRRSCRGQRSRFDRRCVARPRLAKLHQRLFDLQVELVEFAKQLIVPRFESVQQFAGSRHGGPPTGGLIGRGRVREVVDITQAAASIHRLPLAPIAKPIQLAAAVPPAVVASCGATTGYVASDPTLAGAWHDDRKSRTCCGNFACFAGCASRNGWRGRLRMQAVEWRIPVRKVEKPVTPSS